MDVINNFEVGLDVMQMNGITRDDVTFLYTADGSHVNIFVDAAPEIHLFGEAGEYDNFSYDNFAFV
ncbi:hypothetical protein [Sulfitobacter sp. PS-8MA]|uniref:hypothetical protein n=1 Tax=Sulfitobacter sp. PS-8MA TaxID=3237707 RepID=UPI0034C62CB4